LEIDFVNLRSETYASSSRIPEIQFGTAEQDALRRDFTINAMFYNIRHGNVEDLTGKGLEDLRNKLIRTPLPALQTFMDDPLRVMRAIRFASRLNFELDQELVEAASTDEVKEALETKVSRERISTEFEATLEGPDPKLAFRLIRSFQLLDIVLGIPRKVREQLPSGYAEQCINAAMFMADVLKEGKVDKQSTKVGILAAATLPVRDCEAGATGPKGKKVDFPEYVVGLSLKKKKDAALVSALVLAACDMHSVSDSIDDIASVSDEVKVKLGLAIRRAKEFWKIAAALSYVLSLPCGRLMSEEDGRFAIERELSTEDALNKSGKYISKMEQAVLSLKLEKAWQIRPLINGKELIAMLNAKGPVIGKATGEMINWQLAHPEGSVEECKLWLEGIKGNF
jgi:tRNA nucleotidyltransferase/poly(A) polymerase